MSASLIAFEGAVAVDSNIRQTHPFDWPAPSGADVTSVATNEGRSLADLESVDDLSDLTSLLSAADRQAFEVRLAALRNIAGFDTRTLAQIAAEIGVTRANVSRTRLEILRAVGLESYLQTAAARKRSRENALRWHRKKKAQELAGSRAEMRGVA